MVVIYFIVFIVLWSTPAYSNPNEYAASSSNPPNDEKIDHAHFLLNNISNLYLDKEISDVVLNVENEQFHAHRAVLASGSYYFKKLLYGEHKEARERGVTIDEAPANLFKVLLYYMYSGRMDLSIFEGNDIVELFRLSNFFCISNLQKSLTDYLRNNISVDNVCSLLTVARQYDHKGLEADLLNFIDLHVLDVLHSEDSLSLSPEEFQLILNRHTAYANELDIFRAVCRWIKINQDVLDPDAKTNILSVVRYQLMNDEELSEVERSKLVRSDTNILEVIKSRLVSHAHALDYRGQLIPNVNFAEGTSNETSQFNGGTVIKLNHPSSINYIEMKLRDANKRTCYTYYVEVSMDGNHWFRVIDHSSYPCRSVQRLWINRRVVRYIRIVGTENTDGKTFNFLKIMYNTDEMHLVEIQNGLVAPKYNVASHAMDAILVKGRSSIRDDLLFSDFQNYGPGSGYMYHSLGSRCIEVQLAQPYVLSSMRMLLWDRDSGSYGYTVHVSVNNLIWDMIVNKSNGSARSWQLLEFDARLVVYIRITGVYSSNNDGMFKCIYLEAPAQLSPDSM